MAHALEFVLNGEPIRVENVSPNTTLLEFLRGHGLTGAKEGCAEGDCGACSVVLVDGDAQGKPAYRAVNSCLLPVCLLAGREVITVEGVGCSARMHPVQLKMAAGHGSQCGYCTPGFICSLFEGYYRDDLRTCEDLDDQLSGNLCRCSAYRAICDASAEAFVERARNNGQDTFAQRLEKARVDLRETTYECIQEKFVRPGSLHELLRALKDDPEARLIAGATELGLDITKRFLKFPCLISVEAVPELRQLEQRPEEWRIGGAVTLTAIDEAIGAEFPALRQMLRVFGSRQIRNRATMGGNLVTASPIGDSAPVLLALDAKVVLVSLEGERMLPLSEFFCDYRKTVLKHSEILKTILLPRGPSGPGLERKCAWFKVSKRHDMDISTVAACFAVDIDSRNMVQYARLAYGGVAKMPARAVRTEEALVGKDWSNKTIDAVLPLLKAEFTPISDVRGSASYRAELIPDLFRKFFFEAGEGTQEASSPRSGLSTATLMPGRVPKFSPHESAHKHVTGEALYVHDIAALRPMLEVWPVCALHARARIIRRDASAAKTMPGIAAVLLAEDIPGENDVGAVRHDEILFADREVFYHGHMVALVVGETQEACRAAANRIILEYEPLPPILTIEQAIAQNSFHTEPNFIRRGDVQDALRRSPEILEGEFSTAGQEHFSIELQSVWAEAGEDGSMFVMSATQHPSEVQRVVTRVLGVSDNRVVVQCPRLGGGFGGKETQAAPFAALAALAAAKTHRPVRVRINRDLDMMLTGKRHPFLAKFKVGYNPVGELLAAKIELFSNGGWSLDLSMPVTDRAMFHLDNAYYIPHVEFSGRVAKTNLASNTAFRGFGGPQGMLVIEEILARIARRLDLPVEQVRERNLYRGRGETNTTPYGQEIEDNCIQRVWRELKESSAFEQRRAEIAAWNSRNPHHKRGLAITPVKFGVSFTLTHLNQAGALVLIYQDGTVQVNHGGTEMGQGVHTNIAIIAAKELGLSIDRIRVMPTSTDKVPNTSATAASCGTDLNGMAVKNACDILRARLAPIAAEMLSTKSGREVLPEAIRFADNFVAASASDGKAPAEKGQITFCELVARAYFQRISLSSTGYYRTPEIHYDREKGQGHPFLYFAVGAAVTEVEVDGFTGMTRILRTDILHDAGDSINAGVNLGQIEGGFIQGAGWLTSEQLIWDEQGCLLTHSPDTYKVPAVSDRPREFNVQFLSNSTQRQTIHGSKAVGEPPFMLAISVREAIRDAVAVFGTKGGEVPLATPATCEAIYNAIRHRRGVRASSPPGVLIRA